MNCKYVLTFLVALNLGSVFSSERPDLAEELVSQKGKAVLQTLESIGLCDLKKQFKFGGAQLDPYNAGVREFRKLIIGLDSENLRGIVESNNEFFKGFLGVSLIYGWALNQRKEIVTPFYVGKYFSFHKMFEDLANEIGGYTKTFLKSRFILGLQAVEKDRFRFLFDGIIPLHYAISQVRVEKERARLPTLPSSTVGDNNTELSKKLFRETLRSQTEVEQEDIAWREQPGVAYHLLNKKEFSSVEENLLACDSLKSIQQLCIQTEKAEYLKISPSSIEKILSLPQDTPVTYILYNGTIKQYIDHIRETTAKLIHVDDHSGALHEESSDSSLLKILEENSNVHPRVSQQQIDRDNRQFLRSHPKYFSIGPEVTVKRLISNFSKVINTKMLTDKLKKEIIEEEKDAFYFISNKYFLKNFPEKLEENSHAALLQAFARYTRSINPTFVAGNQYFNVINNLKINAPLKNRYYFRSNPFKDAFMSLREQLLHYWQLQWKIDNIK